jgi:hypothetical protein
MQLRAQLSLIVRKREPPQLRAVTVGHPRGWVHHLQLAWTTLHHDLRIPAPKARELIARSVKAAYECATRMNERVQRVNEEELTSRVKQAFERLSHCAKRAPARLRRLLDEKIVLLLRDGEVDLEKIEALFQVSREAFERFPDLEPATTGLSALGVYRQHGYDSIGLATDVSSLSPPLQASCISTLSRALAGGAELGAETVFDLLADGLPPPARLAAGAADITIDYVAAVAAAWRGAGLRATRAFRRRDSGYTSKFHRFCDLVLTALVEPQSRRHESGVERMAQKAWERQRQLPPEVRKYIRGGLSVRDTRWLVTRHCVQQGLGRSKNVCPKRHMTKA